MSGVETEGKESKKKNKTKTWRRLPTDRSRDRSAWKRFDMSFQIFRSFEGERKSREEFCMAAVDLFSSSLLAQKPCVSPVFRDPSQPRVTANAGFHNTSKRFPFPTRSKIADFFKSPRGSVPNAFLMFLRPKKMACVSLCSWTSYGCSHHNSS